jgi:hypothetical protein
LPPGYKHLAHSLRLAQAALQAHKDQLESKRQHEAAEVAQEQEAGEAEAAAAAAKDASRAKEKAKAWKGRMKKLMANTSPTEAQDLTHHLSDDAVHHQEELEKHLSELESMQQQGASEQDLAAQELKIEEKARELEEKQAVAAHAAKQLEKKLSKCRELLDGLDTAPDESEGSSRLEKEAFWRAKLADASPDQVRHLFQAKAAQVETDESKKREFESRAQTEREEVCRINPDLRQSVHF